MLQLSFGKWCWESWFFNIINNFEEGSHSESHFWGIISENFGKNEIYHEGSKIKLFLSACLREPLILGFKFINHLAHFMGSIQWFQKCIDFVKTHTVKLPSDFQMFSFWVSNHVYPPWPNTRRIEFCAPPPSDLPTTGAPAGAGTVRLPRNQPRWKRCPRNLKRLPPPPPQPPMTTISSSTLARRARRPPRSPPRRRRTTTVGAHWRIRPGNRWTIDH